MNTADLKTTTFVSNPNSQHISSGGLIKTPKNEVKFFQRKLRTPLGEMLAVATPAGIFELEFTDSSAHVNVSKNNVPESARAHLDLLEDELAAYFSGKITSFTVPLHVIGTDFRKKVWQSLTEIPYGGMWTYLQQAAFLGDAKKVRAVASANAANKIMILLPCHRVISSSGALSGYRGGVARKEALLALENKYRDLEP